jgi:hypothetical protein
MSEEEMFEESGVKAPLFLSYMHSSNAAPKREKNFKPQHCFDRQPLHAVLLNLCT